MRLGSNDGTRTSKEEEKLVLERLKLPPKNTQVLLTTEVVLKWSKLRNMSI